MTMDEQQSLAAKLLKLTLDEVQEYGGTIPQTHDLYISVPKKGGGSLIIGEDGSVLFAGSAVGFTEHKDAFDRGERTPLDFFD